MRAKAVTQNEIISSSRAIIWLSFVFMSPCTPYRTLGGCTYLLLFGPLFKSRLLSAFAFT